MFDEPTRPISQADYHHLKPSGVIEFEHEKYKSSRADSQSARARSELKSTLFPLIKNQSLTLKYR